jgi:hypothetical protein
VELTCIELHGDKGWHNKDDHGLRQTVPALYNSFFEELEAFEEQVASKRGRWIVDENAAPKMATNLDGSYGLMKSESVRDSGVYTSRTLGLIWSPSSYWRFFNKAPEQALQEFEVAPGKWQLGWLLDSKMFPAKDDSCWKLKCTWADYQRLLHQRGRSDCEVRAGSCIDHFLSLAARQPQRPEDLELAKPPCRRKANPRALTVPVAAPIERPLEVDGLPTEEEHDGDGADAAAPGSVGQLGKPRRSSFGSRFRGINLPMSQPRTLPSSVLLPPRRKSRRPMGAPQLVLLVVRQSLRMVGSLRVRGWLRCSYRRTRLDAIGFALHVTRHSVLQVRLWICQPRP